MYGGVSSHLGDECELDFFVALRDAPDLSGVHSDVVDFDVERNKGRDKVQLDIFLINKVSVAIVEVKRHLQSKYLDQLHNTTVPQFRKLFPEYSGKKLYAAMATYFIPKRAKPYVRQRIDKYGYALLTTNHDHTHINIDAHAI